MVSVFVENKGAYCCLRVWRAGHSKNMCISSATATPPQCVHTLLALALSKKAKNKCELMRTKSQQLL